MGDSQAGQLNAEAVALYRMANDAYLLDPDHVDPYIRINPGNGRRSTVKQAQLYEEFIFGDVYGGPPKPRANQIGKSKHEYGFAMDVIRSNDEARLANALSSNGWMKTVEDEGWHWEATGAASYTALDSHITNVMAPVSRSWALTLSSFYERRKDRIKFMAELEAATRELNTLQREVDDMKRILFTEHDALTEEATKLKQLYNDILTTDQSIIALQRRRANMRFTRCPNKNTYEACRHPDLKAQYDEELRQLDLAIEQMRARRKGLARDYDDRRRRLQTARAQYAQKEARWRARNQALTPARRNVISKRAAITKSERQMQQARNSSTLQLQNIVALVKAWG